MYDASAKVYVIPIEPKYLPLSEAQTQAKDRHGLEELVVDLGDKLVMLLEGGEPCVVVVLGPDGALRQVIRKCCHVLPDIPVLHGHVEDLAEDVAGRLGRIPCTAGVEQRLYVPALDVLEVLMAEGRKETFSDLQFVAPYGVVPQVLFSIREVILGHKVIEAHVVPYDNVRPRHLRPHVLQGTYLTHRGHDLCVPKALAVQVPPHIHTYAVFTRRGLLDHICWRCKACSGQ